MMPSFQDAAKQAILKKGRLIREGDNYYWGWHDYDNDITSYQSKHEAGCHFILNGDGGKIIEKTFYEFAGTEADSSKETLLVLSDVDCYCGLIKGRRVGMQGSTGELLHELLGIEYESEY